MTFEEQLGSELATVPEIRFLDDYIHLQEQLKAMRARSQPFIPGRFAMEMAVYLRLLEYDEKIGLPMSIMPRADGQGGVCPEDIVPVECLAD